MRRLLMFVAVIGPVLAQVPGSSLPLARPLDPIFMGTFPGPRQRIPLPYGRTFRRRCAATF